MIKISEYELKELKDKYNSGWFSFEDIYDEFIDSDYDDNYSDMSWVIDWGLSNADLKFLVNKYRKGNAKTKEFIEDLLTDCNFHTECSYLMNGEYDKVGKKL